MSLMHCFALKNINIRTRYSLDVDSVTFSTGLVWTFKREMLFGNGGE